MTSPDLTDPATRAAYLAELRQVARGARLGGLTLAVVGAGLAVVRTYWLPQLPAWLPLAVIATALGLILIGIVRRTRWHLAHMGGRAKRPDPL
ncbi:MAG: hypothetical protein V4659_13485 [Pseudomonadota bacterium]